MIFNGEITSITQDWFTGDTSVTLKLDNPESADRLSKLSGELDIEINAHKEKRSISANALFWACVGTISRHLGADKWEIYKRLLKSYGKFTYICVIPERVKDIQEQWRDSEVIGDTVINGKPAKQMLCYFGSSTYNSEEFSALLDGTIQEMKEMGIPYPSKKEKEDAIAKHNSER